MKRFVSIIAIALTAVLAFHAFAGQARAQDKKAQKAAAAAAATPTSAVIGTITAVHDNGKSVTVTGTGGTKKQPAATTEVKITDNTKFLYLGIEDKAEQKLRPGLSVLVKLDDKEKDVAAGMLVSKAAEQPRKKKKDK